MKSRDEKGILLDRMLAKVGDFSFRRRILTLLEYLDIQDGDSLLDCGCGEGFYSMILSELHDVEVTAFDFNAELLERAEHWVPNGKIRFLNGDISKGLPFHDHTFNKIIFSEILEHLDKDLEALKEIYRVLKPGGMVGLTVPNENYPFFLDPLNWLRGHLGLGHFNPKNTFWGGVWSYDHKRLYSLDPLRGLVESVGFKVVEARGITHYCLPFHYYLLRLGKVFYTKLPVSKRTKEAAEKFEWKKEDVQNGKPDLMKMALGLLRWADRKNDSFHDLKRSSVSIALKMSKG